LPDNYHPLCKLLSFNLNRVLGKLQRNKAVVLKDDARKDLYVWTNFILEDCHPIASPHFYPPLVHDTYISDAEGCTESRCLRDLLGCGSIGLKEDNELIFVRQLFWPSGVL
jgi:hypothetical protein